MSARLRVVLFDLDGTLIDTAPDLTTGINGLLGELDRGPYDEATVRGWIGDGARVLVHRALFAAFDGEVDAALEARGLELFMRHYRECLTDTSRPYPGVAEALATLAGAGVGLACVTNKPEGLSRELLGALALDAYFGAVVGGDTLAQKKPHPAPLAHALAALEVSAGQALMVGDSPNDLHAGRAAGCRVAAVTWGYGEADELRALTPDAVLDKMSQLHALLDKAA